MENYFTMSSFYLEEIKHLITSSNENSKYLLMSQLSSGFCLLWHFVKTGKHQIVQYLD